MKPLKNAEPVMVNLQQNRIVSIVMQDKTVAVYGVATAWIARGKWWYHDEKRHYVRLLTSSGTIDVYREGVSWFLVKVLD